MTYLQFHLIFNLPALLLLLWLTRRRLRWVHLKWIAALCAIVLLTTTPWDNWAVHGGIWDFDWPRTTEIAVRLGGVKWRLPAEEYAFFLVETVLVSLLTILFLPSSSSSVAAVYDRRSLPARTSAADGHRPPLQPGT